MHIYMCGLRWDRRLASLWNKKGSTKCDGPASANQIPSIPLWAQNLCDPTRAGAASSSRTGEVASLDLLLLGGRWILNYLFVLSFFGVVASYIYIHL